MTEEMKLAIKLQPVIALLNFVKSCTEYHPDETPEWYLEENDISYEDLDATEHYEALDNAHDSFRDEYGSDADTDTVRSICEDARQLLKDLEVAV